MLEQFAKEPGVLGLYIHAENYQEIKAHRDKQPQKRMIRDLRGKRRNKSKNQ